MKIADYDRILDVNLRGAFVLSQEAARAWRDGKRGGVIVNVASVLGYRQAGGVSAYAISKAGVVQMTKILAYEWARYGIRVNALAPGYFDTAMNEGFFDTDPGKAMIRRIPMRRVGDPEKDIAPLVVFLASEASGYITSRTFHVDGGNCYYDR